MLAHACRVTPLDLVLCGENGDFSRLLQSVGHRVRGVLEGTLENLCIQKRPDLVLCHSKDACVCDRLHMPWVLLATEEEIFREPFSPMLMGVLCRPLSCLELLATVSVAKQRAEEIRELEAEVISLKKQLEERKLVERAKSIVMRMLRIEEDDAYHRLRKYASNNNLKLADVARRIIDSEEPFRQLGEVRATQSPP